jgi:serine/threonine-protein kinase
MATGNAGLSAASASELAVGSAPELRLGNWRLGPVAGTGSWCTVYRARPASAASTDHYDYVVKVLRPNYETDGIASAMLATEVRFARSVNHSRLVPVLASQISRPPYYIVMPYIRGRTLSLLIDRVGRLAIPKAIWFARQALEGLVAIHTAGWIHGDIKSANLLVQPSGALSLFDFGLARTIGEPGATPAGTSLLCGTPGYAAPELHFDCFPVTPASDIYSLGITLFEMLAGRRPFDGPSPHELAAAHLRQPPPDLQSLVPAVPIRLKWLIQEMIAKQPDHRPTTDVALRRLVELEIASLFDYDRGRSRRNSGMVAELGRGD